MKPQNVVSVWEFNDPPENIDTPTLPKGTLARQLIGYFACLVAAVAIGTGAFAALGITLSNDKISVSPKSFQEPCSTNPCLTSLNLVCDTASSTCVCADLYYWNSTTCVPKMEINDACNASILCNDLKQYVCLNGTCQCDSNTTYWDDVTKRCENKLSYGEYCYLNTQCQGGFVCSTTKLQCICANGLTYEPTNGSCVSAFYGVACTVNSDCNAQMGLTCLNNQCLCDPSMIWLAAMSKCSNKLTYSQSTCTQDSDCGQNLICNINPTANQCDCPTISVSGMCDCPLTSTYQTFWNGTYCQDTFTKNQGCQFTYQCQSTLSCIQSRCLCAKLQYWDSTTLTCKNQTLNNTPCTTSSTCRTDLGLTCTNNLCQCDTTKQFWSTVSLQCVNYLTYTQLTCTQNSDCASSLICNLNATTNQCNCPQNSISGMCDCQKDAFNETYWNGTSCVRALLEGQACSQSYQCYNGMTCANGVCSCSANQYLNTSTMICNNQTLNNTTCPGNYTCRTDLGLSCVSNLCQCDTKTQFWSDILMKCINYLTYNESQCSANSNCKYNLICNVNSTINQCNCPSASTDQMCDCFRNSTYQQYWNGTYCVEALLEGKPCTLSYQCYNGMTCANGVCSCSANQYLDTKTMICFNQTLNNTYCPANYTCRGDLGLSCVSNLCQCDTKTQFWSAILMKCINYLSYNESQCTQDSNCKYNLICNVNSTINQCNCPAISVDQMCDCYRNSTYQQFWNGTYCVKTYMEKEACLYSYQCFGTLTCNSGFCTCGLYQYQDPVTLACMNQTLNNTTCPGNYSCRSDLGLSCQSGLCQCDTKTQFWSDLLGKCINLLNYNESICVQTSNCKDTLYCYIDASVNQCNCPANSTNGICDCFRNSTYQQFWNGTYCVQAYMANEPCLFSYQCFGALVCTNGTCACGLYQYFDPITLTCQNQTLNNTACSANYTCRGDLGLSCQSGLCQCDLTRLKWNELYQICMGMFTYNESVCMKDLECQSNLICNLDPVLNNCSCPANSFSGMCDCRYNMTYQEFWNGTFCTETYQLNQTCNATYQCFTNMTCTAGLCQCPSFTYYNTSVLACLNQTLNYTVCSSNISCRSDLGLSCQNGLCQCDTTIQYWDPKLLICTNYLGYGRKRCTDNYQCVPNTICNLDATLNACDCPTTSAKGMCDCLRVAFNEYYWSGSSCIAASTVGQSCVYGQNYTCQQLTVGQLYCTTNGVCSCLPYYYYDTSSKYCLPQTLVNTYCTVNIACRNDLGLICVNNMCVCDSKTQFWSTSLGKCINYLTYGGMGCDSTSNCVSGTGLICNLSPTTNNCTCPTLSQATMCDCPRTVNNETYWSGTACVPASNYSKTCVPNKDYSCRQLYMGRMFCNSSGICNCGPSPSADLGPDGKCRYCGSSVDYWPTVFKYPDSCYAFSKILNSASNVDMKCATDFTVYALNGTTPAGAKFSTTTETDYIINYIKATSYLQGPSYWVSASSTSGNTWQWRDGSVLVLSGTYSWCAGCPTKGSHCLTVNSVTYCFEDFQCGKTYNYICQYNV